MPPEKPAQQPESLKSKARELPASSGVYLMKDNRDRVIYIGKAKSLKDRVGSYFTGSHDPKTTLMVSQVCDFEYLKTDSEVDALLLEARLIKDVQPKYNLMLKDDKTFPLLAISKRTDFPLVAITRDRDVKNMTYYGPFMDSYGLRMAVKFLQKAFKFRTCTMEIKEGDPKRYRFRPCLLYHIKQCTAPCAAKISNAQYNKDIARLKKFLAGRGKSVIRELEAGMKRAAQQRNYEAAAEYRDQIRALQSLSKRSLVGDLEGAESLKVDVRVALTELQQILKLDFPPRTIEGVDIAHLQGAQTVGSLVSFIDGAPFKAGYRRYKIQGVQGVDDFASLKEVATRRFTRLAEEGELFPDLFLIDGGLGQLHAVQQAFEALKMDPPVLVSLAKKEEILYSPRLDGPLKLERRSAGLQLLQHVRDEAHRFAQAYHHTLRRKNVIKD